MYKLDIHDEDKTKFIDSIYREILKMNYVNRDTFVIFSNKSTEIFLESKFEMKNFIDEIIKYYSSIDMFERCQSLEFIQNTHL